MPWRLVLLWLCIALLPLRGWAAGAPPATPMHADTHHAAVHPGCHAMVPAETAAGLEGHPAAGHSHASMHGPASADEAASELPSAGSCALCEVCHGAAMLAPLPLDGFAPLNPGAPPAWAPQAVGRLAVHELFRPPRA